MTDLAPLSGAGRVTLRALRALSAGTLFGAVTSPVRSHQRVRSHGTRAVLGAVLTLAGCGALGSTVARADTSPYAFSRFAGPPGAPGGGWTILEDAPMTDVSRSGAFLYATVGDRVTSVDAVGEEVHVAGGGSVAPSTTPIAPLSAQLGDPAGVVTGASANGSPGSSGVYIADAGRSEVDEITSAGLFVLAGGGTTHPVPGTTYAANRVSLSSPEAIALDAAGDLYIADTGADEVDEVTPDGRLAVVAGTGAAGLPTAGPATQSALDAPRGLALDGAGDLFIADSGNQTVDEVDPTTHMLAVAAGIPGEAGVSTAGRATGVTLSTPTSLAFDEYGNLDVLDASDPTIDRVDPAGGLTVIAGTGARGTPVYGANATQTALGDPRAIAFFPDGSGYLAIAGGDDDSIDSLALIGPPFPQPLPGATPTATSPAPSLVTPGVRTMAARPLRAGALLRARIAPHGLPDTVAFQYGHTTAYGHRATRWTLPASATSRTVTVRVGGLMPGTTYHDRVLLGTAGGTAGGADSVVTIPRARPGAIITIVRRRALPGRYTVTGRVDPGRGLRASAVCATRGHLTVLVLSRGRVVRRATVRINARTCAYRARLTTGHGAPRFRAIFHGNRQLTARRGRSVSVRR